MFIVILCIACNTNDQFKNSDTVPKAVDSISILIEQSKNSASNLDQQKKDLLKAYKYNSALKNDTLKNKNLTEIAEQIINFKDARFFKKVNNEVFLLSKKLKDTFGIGESFRRYGNYYLLKEDLDSAYYFYQQAYKLYDIAKDEYHSGRILYGMASVKTDLRDYTGSEKLTFQAIKKLSPLNKNTSLYLCHYLQGVNFYELKEYEKALFYHQKAIKYLEKAKYKANYRELSLNFIGNVYTDMGRSTEAVNSFEKALEYGDLRNSDIRFYATVTDNLAYAKFKNGDTLNVEKQFKEALKIRDSVNNVSGIVINKLHLAEYYVSKKDTAKAIEYTIDAGKLAKSVNNHRDRLAALKLLSKLDKTNAKTYLEEYIALSDSLHTEERTIRNKSTRIEYETDEYIEETERLALQNILITVIGGVLILVFALLYFIRRQRAKNKELLFESEQQKANEEIYSLMLKQQVKLEEGRTEERVRISEELHDGVLGKLFGTRVGLGFLALKGEDEDMEDYNAYVEELQGIEKEIRDISHELKNDILKSKTGLVSIIDQYINNLSKLQNFKYTVSSDSEINWDTIDDKLKVTLYRIIQEAIQNIIKHAKANTVAIAFSVKAKLLYLTITDDGMGFDTNKKNQGIGLKNMKSRILKHQGEFRINAVTNEGTTITIIISI